MKNDFDNRIYHTPSGSTASCAFISTNEIYIANCGNTRIAMFRNGKCFFKTKNHYDYEEKDRIDLYRNSSLYQKIRNSITTSRVLGNCNLKNYDSACLEQAIIPLPDVYEIIRSKDDEFLVIASNSVWDYISEKDMYTIISTEENDLKKISSNIIDFCFKKGSRDNLSCMIINIASCQHNSDETDIIKENLKIQESTKSLLNVAVERGNFNIVKFFLYSLKNQDIYWPSLFENEIKPTHYGIIELFLYHGNDVNMSLDGKTLLYCCIGENNLEIIELLLKKKANPNIKTSTGDFPLLLATREQYVDIVKCLIENNADVNLFDMNGETALSVAIKLRNVEIVKILLRKQVDFNSINIDGETNINIAVKSRNVEIVRLLVFDEILDKTSGITYSTVNDICIDDRDKFGQTPLHVATKNGDFEIVKILLDCYADLNIQDENGETPLAIARRNGNIDIANYMLNA